MLRHGTSKPQGETQSRLPFYRYGMVYTVLHCTTGQASVHHHDVKHATRRCTILCAILATRNCTHHAACCKLDRPCAAAHNVCTLHSWAELSAANTTSSRPRSDAQLLQALAPQQYTPFCTLQTGQTSMLHRGAIHISTASMCCRRPCACLALMAAFHAVQFRLKL